LAPQVLRGRELLKKTVAGPARLTKTGPRSGKETLLKSIKIGTQAADPVLSRFGKKGSVKEEFLQVPERAKTRHDV